MFVPTVDSGHVYSRFKSDLKFTHEHGGLKIEFANSKVHAAIYQNEKKAAEQQELFGKPEKQR